MTFRFETDYDLETLTAMAKGIRRTVRKKRSCLVHIFAALVVLMEAFFLLMDLRKNALDVGDVLALIAVLAIIIVVRTEDRLNARTARARLLPGTEHASTVFDEDGYTVKTSVNEGRWQYKQIFAVAETERYFILTLSKDYAQAVDKEGMQGGSTAEFRAFIKEKTGKPVVYIK
jgi:hypothetical protein